MDIDPAPVGDSMPPNDEPELLGMAAGSDSPVTAREDRVLDTPAGFSRAPGDGRPTPESSTGATGRRIRAAQSRDVMEEGTEDGRRNRR